MSAAGNITTRDLRFEIGGADAYEVLLGVFRAAFTASEGAAEGDAIAALVAELIRSTPTADLDVVSAWQDEVPVACIIFTPLRYSDDPRQVVLLAPVAVIPETQRSGVGQALIAYGLELMRSKGADVILTYGDPAYYSKSGFLPAREDAAPPPYPLSMPQGWQALVLDGQPLSALGGQPTCAEAWQNPDFW